MSVLNINIIKLIINFGKWVTFSEHLVTFSDVEVRSLKVVMQVKVMTLHVVMQVEVRSVQVAAHTIPTNWFEIRSRHALSVRTSDTAGSIRSRH